MKNSKFPKGTCLSYYLGELSSYAPSLDYTIVWRSIKIIFLWAKGQYSSHISFYELCHSHSKFHFHQCFFIFQGYFPMEWNANKPHVVHSLPHLWFLIVVKMHCFWTSCCSFYLNLSSTYKFSLLLRFFSAADNCILSFSDSHISYNLWSCLFQSLCYIKVLWKKKSSDTVKVSVCCVVFFIDALRYKLLTFRQFCLPIL